MSDTASPFSTTSPRDGSTLSPVRATEPSDLPAIVGAAHRAQELWAARPLEARFEALRAFKGRVLDRGTELATLISLETGKPEVEALLAEVLATADVSSLGYADPDVDALQGGGLSSDITLATTKGPPMKRVKTTGPLTKKTKSSSVDNRIQ